jgi:putative ABC transport system permease protein
MTRRRDRPPRIWAGLLEWLLEETDAEAILGDLEEEYRETVVPRRGRRAARRWYRRMALDSLRARVGRGRARRLRPQAPRSPNPGRPMESLLQDARFSARTLWRRKAFSGAVVATLALAVGVNTAVFAVLDGVLLEPLPYPDADELVTVWQANMERPDARGEVSLPNFRDWRERSTTVAPLASHQGTSFVVTGLGDPEVVPAAFVSDRFFEVFGASPVQGREISEDEARAGGPEAVVLSHGWWETRFGSDPDVVGREVELDGTPHTVVGVAPPGFDFPGGARLWVGSEIDPQTCGRGCVNFEVVGRLAEGTEVETARSEFDAIARSMASDHGMEGYRVNMIPLKEVVVGDLAPVLLLLVAAVTAILLIACANVANLLLARARDRADELSVRAALGAGRGRIVEQLLTESAMLAVAGGAGGAILAWVGLRVLRSLPDVEIPRLDTVGIDPTVGLFLLAVVVAAVVLFGLAPAVTLARRSLARGLRRDSGRMRGRGALVATQVALSATLFLGTGLLLRTVLELRSVELGFAPPEDGEVRILALSVPQGDVPEPEEVIALHERFRERLARVPGVASVGAAFGAPLSEIDIVSSMDVRGWTRSEAPANAGIRTVTPGYLETLEIPVVAGRGVRPTDRLGSQRVAWINETAAARWFGNTDPVGRVIDISASAGLPERDPRTVVGVVADTRFNGPRADPPVEVYVPHAQNGVRFLEYFVRTRPGAGPVLPAARDALADLSTRIPVQDQGSLAERVAGVEADTSLWTALMGIFAALALGLASVGLAGVVTYQVSVRRREIGVRMALGADGPRVVRRFLLGGLRPALVGLVVGLGLSALGVRLLEGLLFGVVPTDPVAWVGVAGTLLVVVVVASGLPALRAAGVDPARQLRSE